MKKILVLTDFSQNSINAYGYAVKMACQLKAEILLLFSTNGTPLSLTNQLQYSQQLHSFAKRYACDSRRQQNPHNTECLISGDTWVSLLPTMASVHHPDLIVAGSGLLAVIERKGQQLNLQEIAGSPVLWIPEKALYQPLKHLVFVTDYLDQDPEVIDLVKRYAQTFEAEVSSVHFYSPAERKNLAEIKKQGAELNWVLGNQGACHMLEEEDIIEGLEEYTEKYAVDLFLISTRDTHVTHQYLHQVYRKTDACQNSIPLLNLYQAKNNPCARTCTHCQAYHAPSEASLSPQL
ncbi:universal stress protein [Rufibacter hautae]|uniref:Universal stress protein n=1 Tax=Rufibacter hautae TaxID=2595005 RepID=A0A5B6TDX4_9BACT|nr:universal stress protein [Rufibacter hautae]KAA3437131.1 universal stress protein [Rufibacter hautae]